MIEEQNVSMILIILYLAVKDIIVPLVKKVTNGGKNSASDLWTKLNKQGVDIAEIKTDVAVIKNEMLHIKRKK